MTELISSLIVAIITLVGTVITCKTSSNKTNTDIKINQAITDTKIDELTREVREQNNFTYKIPILLEKVDTLEKRVTNIENRVN